MMRRKKASQKLRPSPLTTRSPGALAAPALLRAADRGASCCLTCGAGHRGDARGRAVAGSGVARGGAPGAAGARGEDRRRGRAHGYGSEGGREKENVATSFWERSRTFELRPNAAQAAQAAQLAAEMWAAHSCAGAAVAKGLVAETIDRADDIVRVTRTSAARHSEPR